MKVVILAGGKGTRISEETDSIPKPMIEIGSRPIIWHIMKLYSQYGFNDFVICLGYKGYIIKEYFSHYFLHMSDVTIDLKNNKTEIHGTTSEPWKITLVDTGIDSLTGSRLRAVQSYLSNETFMMTYGDGVGDINIDSLIRFHNEKKVVATVTAVRPLGRFGSINLGTNDKVTSFSEKSDGDNSWINAGFFVLGPEIFNYIEPGNVSFEKQTLQSVAKEGKLTAYKHNGFWKPMDTLRDKLELEHLWQTGSAPWKAWK